MKLTVKSFFFPDKPTLWLKCYTKSHQGLKSGVVKSSRLPAKIATYLVSFGKLLCLAFFHGQHFLLIKSGLEVNFLVQSQSFACKIFFHQQTSETTSKLFPFVQEPLMILTRKRLLVDIFLTRRLSKSLAFREFASVNFEP